MWKTNNFLDDPKQRKKRLALSCSKKTPLLLLRGITLKHNYDLEKNNILEFNWYIKSDKLPYIIYADIESLIKSIDGCANNLENSLTTKIGELISCGYLMSTIWAFDNIKNKHTLYRRKNCMKMFC